MQLSDIGNHWAATIPWVVGGLVISWALAFVLAAYGGAVVPERGVLTYDQPRFLVCSRVPRSPAGIGLAFLLLVSPFMHAALFFSLGGDVLPDQSLPRRIALAVMWQPLQPLVVGPDETCSGSFASYWVSALLCLIVICVASACNGLHALQGIREPTAPDARGTLRWWRAPVSLALFAVVPVPFMARLLKVVPCRTVHMPTQDGFIQELRAVGVCPLVSCGDGTHAGYIAVSIIMLCVAAPVALQIWMRFKSLNAEEYWATPELNCVKFCQVHAGWLFLTTIVAVTLAACVSTPSIATAVVVLAMTLQGASVAYCSLPSSSLAITVLYRWGRALDCIAAIAVFCIALHRYIAWDDNADVRDASALTAADMGICVTYAVFVMIATLVAVRRWLVGTRSGLCSSCVEPNPFVNFDTTTFRDIAIDLS